MINQRYRLFSPKQIRVDFVDENIGDKVIVRPTYLSICKADQRYYTGNREKSVLDKKLPMSLIHEAVGEVLYDASGEFKKGDKVVMIPNTPVEKDDVIKENYLRSSKFRASGFDGFMQGFVSIDKDRIIKYDDKIVEDRLAVLLEVISVSMNALEHFQHYSHLKKQTIGIWGCGTIGYVTALVLKKTFPNAEIIVFGTHPDKLHYFQFADKCYLVDDIPEGTYIDHAFECVGGRGAEASINQIIDLINPEGSIALMGVSEHNVPINTRMILEKGITLLGNSRSGYEDFYNSIKFLENNDDVRQYCMNLISTEIVVRNIKDIDSAFETDLVNEFKTIMKWEM